MRRTLREPISRPAWQILIIWGLALLIITGLLSWWTARNQRQADRDMCELVSVFLTGPEPVAGPAGSRSEWVREGMTRYVERRHCPPL